MKIATLFSGGELFGVGAKQAGYTHAWGVEYREDIAAVARLNGFDVLTADVRAADYAVMPAVDHLHASPSCKTASNANKQRGETPFDIECGQAVARAIDAHRGNTFSLENVWLYRHYKAFSIILAALKRNGFAYEFSRRLWRATRALAADIACSTWRNPPQLMPTHSEHGDMFTAPHVGWYEAIEDLIPTLPEDAPAPWQVRLLEGRELSGVFVCNGTPNSYGKSLTIRHGNQPIFTMTASMDNRPTRALISGRWVRLTIEALGRLQTVPTWYRGLTAEINGNGVPCAFAKALMEIF